MTDVLTRLYATIASRKDASPESSYTAQLLSQGTKKIAKKLGEETTELVTAALVETPKEIAAESADVLYHLLVLLVDRGVTLEEVMKVLEAREGTSGIEEKNSRKK
ncbi:MAG: phosphoribosyl-ATP diphosphatase [Rickettsiales bacterium]|jgi:phosphoribosyl-ATP pyrophosphohydrolase|nr:phosphoribosyl-ATP diphosphatase [Rickettsiales bacterium]